MPNPSDLRQLWILNSYINLEYNFSKFFLQWILQDIAGCIYDLILRIQHVPRLDIFCKSILFSRYKILTTWTSGDCSILARNYLWDEDLSSVWSPRWWIKKHYEKLKIKGIPESCWSHTFFRDLVFDSATKVLIHLFFSYIFYTFIVVC